MLRILMRSETELFTLQALAGCSKIPGETFSGPENSSEMIGVELAERLVSMGAETIMENLKADLNLNHER